jgi:hypothetical protein
MKSLNSILLIILSSFFLSTAASAQVTELHIGANLNSIVRNVNETTQLIYTEVSPTESYFVLHHEGQPTADVFRLPSNYSPFHIKDVRINKREAYFCGTADGMGMVGKFNIPNVFSGTGQVDYGFLDFTYDSTVYVESLRRLELYNVGNQVCMAMVGVARYDGMTTCPVVSAHLIGTTWHFCTDAQKDEYRFTDISCLDDMIVASGTYQDTLYFEKTFQLAPDFPFRDVTIENGETAFYLIPKTKSNLSNPIKPPLFTTNKNNLKL